MSRKKFFYSMVLATVAMFPLLAVAGEVAMDYDDWRPADLERLGSVEKLDNDKFLLRGRISNECLKHAVDFKIIADATNGTFQIHDRIPNAREAKQGRKTVRDCMAKDFKGSCNAHTCTSLAKDGLLDLAGLNKNVTVHLVADEEGVSRNYALSGDMEHRSKASLDAEKNAAEIKRLAGLVHDCRGQERIAPAQLLLGRGAINQAQMDLVVEAATKDDLKNIAKRAKGSLDDQDEVIDDLLSFANDHGTKYANRVAAICKDIAARYMTEDKTSEGFSKAHETLSQCESIDGLSKSNQLTLARYHDDVAAAELNNLAKQGLRGGAFLPAFQSAQESLTQRYQDACYGDEINPDACNSVMRLADKMDGFYQTAAMADQRRQRTQYENLMRRQQGAYGGGFYGGMGGYQGYIGNPMMTNSMSPYAMQPMGYGGGSGGYGRTGMF